MDSKETLELLNSYMKTGTIWEALDITISEASPDMVSATLPITPHTTQQSGFLHGGALATLAESLSTLGTALNIDTARQMCFCLSLNASHFRSRRKGGVPT
jgi:1,4-dihydroxy-2-naphthoyl-CoA hydrolase